MKFAGGQHHLRLLAIVVFLSFTPAIFGQLFAATRPVILSSRQTGTHFGYSIAAGSRETIIVGAPRSLDNTGAVYSCGLRSPCVILPFTKHVVSKQKNGTFALTSARIGATVAATDQLKNDFVVCAPGFTKIYTYTEVKQYKFYYISGLCHLHINSNFRTEYSHCPREIESYPIPYPSYACSNGFSATLKKFHNKYLLGMGSPGSKTYFSVGVFDFKGRQMNADKDTFVKFATDSTRSRQYVGFSHAVNNDTNQVIYFTHSLKTERLYELRNSKLEALIRLVWPYDAKNLYFKGFSSAMLNYELYINTVRYKFIAIGAPFAPPQDTEQLNCSKMENFNEKCEVGCVYIYKYYVAETGAGTSGGLYDVVCGTEPRGRFGASVLNLGDMNEDNHDDLAIGCPFCSGGGAVYIYTTRSRDSHNVKLKINQVVRERQLDVSASSSAGFGWSLAGGNYLKALVIGSPLRDTVYVVESRDLATVSRSSDRLYIILTYGQYRNNKVIFSRGITGIRLTISFRGRLLAKDAALYYYIIIDPDAEKKKSEKRAYVTTMICVPDNRCEKAPNTKNTFLFRSEVDYDVHLVSFDIKLSDIRNNLLKDLRTDLFVAVTIKPQNETRKDAPVLLDSNRRVVQAIGFKLEGCKCGRNGFCDADVFLTYNDTDDKVPITFVYGEREIKTFTIPLGLLPVSEGQTNKEQLWGARLMLNLPPALQLQSAPQLLLQATGELVQLRPQTTDEQETLYYSMLHPEKVEAMLATGDDASLNFSVSLRSNVSLGGLNSQFEIEISVVQDPDLSTQFANCGGFKDPNVTNNRVTIPMRVISQTYLKVNLLHGFGAVSRDSRNKTDMLEAGKQIKDIVNVRRLGSPLLAAWKVVVNGRSPVRDIAVRLSVPYKTYYGLPLIYFFNKLHTGVASTVDLVTLPRIVSLRGALRHVCRSVDHVEINPYGIKGYSKTMSHALPGERRRRIRRSAVSSSASSSSSSSSSSSRSSSSASSGGSFTFGGDPVTEKLAKINCGDWTAAGVGYPRCAVFECPLPELTPNTTNSQMVVRLDGFVWAKTFADLGLPYVQIAVDIKLVQTSDNMNNSNSLPPYVPPLNLEQLSPNASIHRFFIQAAISKRPVRIKIWPIILGAVLGILLLTIIVIAFWQCGFFNRQRLDKDKYRAISMYDDNYNEDEFYE